MRFMNSGTVTPPGTPFSEGVVVGDVFYLSGQIGHAPRSKDLAPGGIEGETRQVMENIKATLAAHGLAMADLIKCTVMLADMSEWAAFNDVYVTYFEPGRLPARSAFGTSGLALGARVEVECLARWREPGSEPPQT